MGVRSDAVSSLIALLAAGTTFPARLVAGGFTDPPAGRVYYPWLTAADISANRPFALIENSEYDWSYVAGGSSNVLWPTISLSLVLADNDRNTGDFKASALDFAGFVDGVITELAAASGGDGQLSIVAMREVQPPQFTKPTDQDTDVATYWSTRWLLRCASVTVGE